MNATDTLDEAGWRPSATLESPFAESLSEADPGRSMRGFEPWQASLTPFADGEGEAFADESDEAFEEALADIRDEDFHEAVAMLAEETEAAVGERFANEAPLYARERERFAETYLSGVQFESEQYLTELETGIAGLDIGSFSENQIDETLARFDPQSGELTPAGEEFIGKLARKAKKAVKSVAKAAKKLGKLASPFLGPLLKKLRKLVRPLLKRVLSLAIGRLPAPLRPAAQTLADRLMGKAGIVKPAAAAANAAAQPSAEPAAAPAVAIDSEALADSFDMMVVKAMTLDETVLAESETLDTGEDEALEESRDLETLAEARGELIDKLSQADERADLAPAIEQFAPVVLMALRTGIGLVGRPRVVGFLAKYLAGMIGKWVGPGQAKPLANAIVDTGLRMATLEAENEASWNENEIVPAALASIVEDTVRRFAENEDYVFEDEDLAQVELAEAFGEAVATHFPQDHVRSELQLAPSLGGAFVTRRARSLRPYGKYNRTPEIEVSAQMADRLPAFGGTSLGDAARAAGGSFPMRARMHIYQAKTGSTIPAMLRHDRRGRALAYPLTRGAAGMLLREPGLGGRVPTRFMKSPRRIAVGQRVYVLEPVGGSGFGSGQNRAAPSRSWLSISRGGAQMVAGVYLSETQAQAIAEAMRQGRGHGVLLKALVDSLRRSSRSRMEAEEPEALTHSEEFEEFTARARSRFPAGFKDMLRRRIAAWIMPAIAGWVRSNSEAFLRAAAHPEPGVTVRIQLSGVPGLVQATAGKAPTLASLARSLRGTPAMSISVIQGRVQR